MSNMSSVIDTERPSVEWTNYMIELGQYWVENYDSMSKKEGWALFNTGTELQIQAIDEPEEGDAELKGRDGEAYQLITERALQGSKMHLLALYLDGREVKKDQEVWIPKNLQLTNTGIF
jgi:hypothetical protein